MDGISVTKVGFSRIAEGSRTVDGTKIDILARKSPFRRGVVLSENGKKLLEKAKDEAPLMACRKWLSACKLDKAAV